MYGMGSTKIIFFFNSSRINSWQTKCSETAVWFSIVCCNPRIVRELIVNRTVQTEQTKRVCGPLLMHAVCISNGPHSIMNVMAKRVYVDRYLCMLYA